MNRQTSGSESFDNINLQKMEVEKENDLKERQFEEKTSIDPSKETFAGDSNEVVFHAPAGSEVTISIKKESPSERAEKMGEEKEALLKTYGINSNETPEEIVEEYHDDRSENEKQTPPVEVKTPTRQELGFGRKLKRIMMALGITGVMAGAGTKATAGETNPADSLGKKQSIENVSSSKEKISDQVKGDWNDFLGWLKDKGMQGKPELDHNNLGYQLLDQYITEHPGTTLSTEILKTININYGKLREDRLQKIREGKLVLDKGVTEANFMKWVVENNKTEHPEYPGSNFTRQVFPEDFELIMDMGAVDHNAIAKAAMSEKGVTGKMNNMTMADQKVQQKVSKGFAQVGPDYSKKTNTVSLPGSDVAKNK